MFDGIDTTPLYETILIPILVLAVFILVPGFIVALILRKLPIPYEIKNFLLGAACLAGTYAWAKFYMNII